MCNAYRTELYRGLAPCRSAAVWNHYSALRTIRLNGGRISGLGDRVGVSDKKHMSSRESFKFGIVPGQAGKPGSPAFNDQLGILKIDLGKWLSPCSYVHESLRLLPAGATPSRTGFAPAGRHCHSTARGNKRDVRFPRGKRCRG